MSIGRGRRRCPNRHFAPTLRQSPTRLSNLEVFYAGEGYFHVNEGQRNQLFLSDSPPKIGPGGPFRPKRKNICEVYLFTVAHVEVLLSMIKTLTHVLFRLAEALLEYDKYVLHRLKEGGDMGHGWYSDDAK